MSKTNIQVQLSGEDGEKVHNSNSYDEALQVIMSYVDVL